MTRAGYPNRSAHGAFHARYRALAPGAPGAAALAAAVAGGRHAFGRTRVYLRAGCLEDLERRLRAARGAAATAVAPALRPAFGAVGAKSLFPSSLVLISMVTLTLTLALALTLTLTEHHITLTLMRV